MLHFPIVLIFITGVMQLKSKKVSYALLTVSCIAALITAISGFFLGLGSDKLNGFLYWHQIMGAAVALGMTVWYWVASSGYSNRILSNALSILLMVLTGFTGHYGGMITHGKDFLALPSEKRNDIIPENPLIYQHIVAPILDDKCVKCHNPDKIKGELLMTGFTNLLKGGESGKTIIPGNPDESELISRLELPLEDEDHMPPEGETPLTTTEIMILKGWITRGASDTLRLEHLENTDPLGTLIKALMVPEPQEKWQELAVVADSTLARLGSDYLTISRIAATSNALRVAMYNPPDYDPGTITRLKPIAENIVELDLSDLPIGKKEMDMIAGCSNLEWLEIDGTPVDDGVLDTLKVLSKIRLLKVYETNIGDNSLVLFEGYKNLEQLYLWQTDVSEAALGRLKKLKPELKLYRGIDEGLREFFLESDTLGK